MLETANMLPRPFFKETKHTEKLGEQQQNMYFIEHLSLDNNELHIYLCGGPLQRAALR